MTKADLRMTERVERLEKKMDRLCVLLEKASGGGG
jgi:hypothetical protein